LSDVPEELSSKDMKKLFPVLSIVVAAAILCGFSFPVLAQTNSTAIAAGFLEQAKSAGDAKLGDIATELTGKVQKLESLLGTNSVINSRLDSTLMSLTGGHDSAALTSAFDLVKGAKPTPEQLGLAKQVGNLTSAYVVQKNFATLEGSQNDVATIVSSLRSGKVTDAIPSLKNVASSAHLTDPQKQLITTIADKYAPGWKKAGEALDGLKRLPGF
jgi:hypothetical protein